MSNCVVCERCGEFLGNIEDLDNCPCCGIEIEHPQVEIDD